jgi:hypothetical protein
MMVWSEEEWAYIQRLKETYVEPPVTHNLLKHYDQDLDPMTAAEWMVANGRLDGWKRIGLLETTRVRISTVWIGLSMGMEDGDTIGVFETLMEGEGAEEFGHGDIVRHRTREEAVRCFNDLVAAATLTDDVVIMEKMLP